MLLYSGAKWPRLALSWPAPIAPFPSAFRRKQRHPSSGNRGLFNFADLYAWYGHNCMHGTVLTCLSHSAAKQSSAGGKRGSKGRHGIDTVFSGGPPPLPV